MTVSDRSIYSIGALARMLGVSPATLRSWEDRYGLVVPERSAGSQRLYSRDHLDQEWHAEQPGDLGGLGAEVPRLAPRRGRGEFPRGVVPCVLVGQDRVRQTRAKPLGAAALRQARRGMRLAEELGLPLVTIIDTS